MLKIFFPSVVFIALMLSSALAPCAESPNDILVVVNKKLDVSSVSIGDLKEIFHKQRTNWKTGGKVTPIHSKDLKLKEQFLKKVFTSDIPSEEAYWQNEKIRTGLTPPPDLSSTLKAIFHLPDAVGYVYRSEYLEGVVKVLLVIPE